MKNEHSEYHNNLYYGASPEIFKRADELRKQMTEAEKVLWEELRRKNFENYKFRRQHPINKFIADFYCHEAKLIVEIDGGIHDLTDIKEHDAGREIMLKQFGLKIIRFTNKEVINEIKEVLYQIKTELEKD